MLVKNRVLHRLVSQTLRVGGLGLMVVSSITLFSTPLPAYANLVAPFQAAAAVIQRIAQVQTVMPDENASPEPTPTPSPAVATPPPGLHVTRGGPLRFTFTGSLSLGSQVHNNSTNQNIFTPIGSSPSPSPSATASTFPFQAVNQNQNQANGSAGGSAELERRTATTLTDIRIPIGYGTQGGSTIGAVQAIYSTPHYSLSYSPQQLTLFGQLPLGSTLRGLEFFLPFGNGQEVFYEGPAIGAAGETLRLEGLLALQQFGSTFYEAGFDAGTGYQTGAAKTLVFGAATSRGNISLIGEGAWQTRSGGDGTPYGVAFQGRFDDNAVNSGFQATIRSVPNEFVAFGAGEINTDKYVDLSWHGGTSPTVLVDSNYERTGNSTVGVSTQFLETLAIGGQFKQFGYNIGAAKQDVSTAIDGAKTSEDNSALQAQIETTIRSAQTVLGVQFLRSIQAGTPTSTRTLAASITRPFGLFNVGITLQSQRQTTAGIGSTTLSALSPAVTRQFGKTTYQLGYTFTHTVSPTSDATQRSPLFSVTRQISPVVNVQVSGGYQSLTDRLDPSADGHSRVLSLTIDAPFTFGNGVTTGRADARLPATISGHVQVLQSTTTNSAFSGFNLSSASGATGGIANAVVVMDDRLVQRTDLTGGFQFPFVPPGQHQLRVEASSLPRGVTVTTPIVTVTVQGGQTAVVSFQVGNFGGILGHVYGADSTGNKVPLENVQLRIDGGAYAQTDTTGAYGFGGLSPGPHTVTVIENTIPAFATFDPALLKQTVQVVNGAYTNLDFSATPLGSIAGKILYGAEMATQGYKGGVQNAYVVAEPGEHAAIDDEDGSFVIDNLPPGDYTVSVDPETLEGGFGAQPDSVTVHLGPGEHYDGALYLVGRFEKKVVFSLLSGTQAGGASAVHLNEPKLPPQGSTTVTIDAPASAKNVSVTFLNHRQALTYDSKMKTWRGEIAVPSGTVAGEYSVTGSVAGGVAPTAASLTVDPKEPLAIIQYTPKNPPSGATVTIHARFLVDVEAGDQIEWEDGQTTVLGKPVAGRVFAFTKRISLLPLHGVLLTKHGRLPIEIL